MADNMKDKAIKAKEIVVDKVKEIKLEDVIRKAIKIPGVKINRERYLRKELQKYYSEDILKLAIENNPAYAGINRETIDVISSYAIKYETKKVTAISFAAGVPGGTAMIATVPTDVVQYFGFMLRIMQKLAYLYGFPDFELDEEEISDETMDKLLLFFGVMFGIQGANAGVKKLAAIMSRNVSKKLAQKALTKTAYYPIIKKIAAKVGIKLTKQIFADAVSKVVPVIGGVASGALSYFSFKPCARKLKKSFMSLPLSDPEFYKEERSRVQFDKTDELNKESQNVSD